MRFEPLGDRFDSAEYIIMTVYDALQAKGYDPITQLVGYLMTGDPTYITNYKGARALICRLDRDAILEELTQYYVQARD